VDQWALPIKNPICALTGIVISVIGLLPQGGRVPPMFAACKAALVVLGVGTVLYHSLTPEQAQTISLSYRMCDWFSMALTGCCLITLFLSQLVSGDALVWTLTIAFLWMGVLVVENDTVTYEQWVERMAENGNRNDFDTIMSTVLMVPMGIVLLWALITRNLWLKVTWMWVWLGLTMITWLSNSYRCKDTPALFILHAIFHITAAMLILQAACIGVGLDEAKWEVQPGFWPWIQEKNPQATVAMAASMGIAMPRISKMA
jgi:hypothetical protein